MTEKRVFQLTTRELTDLIENSVKRAVADIVGSAITKPEKIKVAPEVKTIPEKLAKRGGPPKTDNYVPVEQKGIKRGRPPKEKEDGFMRIVAAHKKIKALGIKTTASNLYVLAKACKVRTIERNGKQFIHIDDLVNYFKNKH